MSYRDISTFVNVIKRREDVLYRTQVPPYSSNIAYVVSESLSSLNSLNITDRSSSLSGNRVEDVSTSVLTEVKSFTANTPNFLLTDIFTSNTGPTPIPLFYQHILDIEKVPRVSGDDLTLDGCVILGIEILDTFLQPVSVPALYTDRTQGIVYSNFVSKYINETNYEIYYVKYTVRIGTGVNAQVITYTDLLNQTSIYREAEFEDLTPFMFLKTDGRRVYLIEEQINGYLVTLPSITTVAFKQTVDSRIQLLPPVPQEAQDPWFVRVTNGSFNQSVNGIIHKYRIAEFLNQAFYPEPVIKYSDFEYSTVVGRSTIKTDYQNILIDDEEGFHIKLLINSRDGTGIAALTTDSDLIDGIAPNGKRYQKWDLTSRIGIKSVDRPGGFLDIDGVTLKTTYEIQTAYYFTETNYEFTLIDFNPVSNKEILNYQVSLFVYPEASGSARSRTLYYLKVDETGRVIQSNWDDFNNETRKLNSGNLLYYKDIPSYLTSPDPYERFIEDYSVEASGVDSTGNFLILGDISVAAPATIDGLDIVDARRRGGGVIDTMFEDAIVAQPEARWYWDEGYWDGIPYPGNASYMVEVPITLLEGTGGRFQSKEISDIVNKHTAIGVYPAIRAYGVDVTISGVNPGATSITISWSSTGNL